MKETKFNDSFGQFPYRSDFTEGRTNNGGIDLILEPDRIGQITEASGFPALKDALESINGPTSTWMTLGCEAGEDDGHYSGYLEFTPRHSDEARLEENLSVLDFNFEEWLKKKWPEHAVQIMPAFSWEYMWFSFNGRAVQIKVSAFVQAMNKKALGDLFTILKLFLTQTEDNQKSVQ